MCNVLQGVGTALRKCQPWGRTLFVRTNFEQNPKYQEVLVLVSVAILLSPFCLYLLAIVGAALVVSPLSVFPSFPLLHLPVVVVMADGYPKSSAPQEPSEVPSIVADAVLVASEKLDSATVGGNTKVHEPMCTPFSGALERDCAGLSLKTGRRAGLALKTGHIRPRCRANSIRAVRKTCICLGKVHFCVPREFEFAWYVGRIRLVFRPIPARRKNWPGLYAQSATSHALSPIAKAPLWKKRQTVHLHRRLRLQQGGPV